ncbi:MAG: thioesterase family protein [Acidobacteriaceae bacterium]
MSHVNSFVRVPWIVLRHKLRALPRLDLLETDRVRLRVWPTDMDFNLHMNNARYLSYMDYGRVHLTAALGLLDEAMEHRWVPLVGSVVITYRRSIGLWKPFTLGTRVLCWDEKWFYMEQTFHTSNGLAAIAWVKALFRTSGHNVPTERIVERIAPGRLSPPMPANIAHWNDISYDKLHSLAALDASAHVRKGRSKVGNG